ncbi:MAG: substrate-binding domain-containing protein [Planctomycetaceae bacterium]|jgi:accessory colonization factor AcfC|nr:substrate-binding domain-containing protein [Planctomycetaceae bacterium]
MSHLNHLIRYTCIVLLLFTAACSRKQPDITLYTCETLQDPMKVHANEFTQMTSRKIEVISIRGSDETAGENNSTSKRKKKKRKKKKDEEIVPEDIWEQNTVAGLPRKPITAPDIIQNQSQTVLPPSFFGKVNPSIQKAIESFTGMSEHSLGDIWVTDSNRQTEELQKQGLAFKEGVIGYLMPVLLVRGGNPKRIFAIEDIFAENIRIGILRPDCGGLGEVGESVVQWWEQMLLTNNVRAETFEVLTYPTENNLVAALVYNEVDVIIAWDAYGLRYQKFFNTIPLLGLEQERLTVPIRFIQLSSMSDYQVPEKIYQTIHSLQGNKILKHFGIRVN